MFLSVFDIFKIGIGPSSSHTVGPMVAARRFVEEDLRPVAGSARRLTVSLHGSLAFTGKGHGTDRAIALALAGETPDTRRSGSRAGGARRARRSEERSPRSACRTSPSIRRPTSSSTTARRFPATPTA